MTALLALSHAQTLLAAIVFIVAASGLVWLVLGRQLRLARGAPRLLALANLLLAVALAAHAGRGLVPDWLGFWGSDALALTSFAAMRAAVPAIAGQVPAWRDGAWIGGVAVLVLALMPYGADLHRHSMIVYAALSLLALLAWRDAYRQLRGHVRRPLALALSGPWLIVALITALRLAKAWWAPQASTDIGADNAFNVAWLWTSLLMSLVLNATMAVLILMRLVLRIQRLTRHDPLTDALNRRAFGAALDAAHGRLQRGEPYALLLLDLDGFKALNDGLGHAAGDAALQQVAAALRRGLRETDALGRLGGEEFSVLLPRAGLDEALIVAERLRAQLELLPFEWQGRRWPLSASIGVAQARPDDISAEPVLGRADAAMYRAKEAGRNCVRPQA